MIHAMTWMSLKILILREIQKWEYTIYDVIYIKSLIFIVTLSTSAVPGNGYGAAVKDGH